MFYRFRLAFLPAMIAALFASASISAALAAQAPDFRVYNNGNHPIIAVNVSPHASDSWGPNLLDGYLEPDEYVTPLAVYGYLPSCYQDVRVIYANAHVQYYYDIDVCDNNLQFFY